MSNNFQDTALAMFTDTHMPHYNTVKKKKNANLYIFFLHLKMVPSTKLATIPQNIITSTTNKDLRMFTYLARYRLHDGIKAAFRCVKIT